MRDEQDLTVTQNLLPPDEHVPEADVPLDDPRRPQSSAAFTDVMAQRLQQRRQFLKTLAGVSAAIPVLVGKPELLLPAPVAAGVLTPRADGLRFEAISGSTTDELLVPASYQAEVLLRWGDALDGSTPDLDTADLASLLKPGAAARQARQFGYNCDFNGYFALPRPALKNSHWGLLATNHEYTSEALMLPGWPGAAGAAQFVSTYPEAVGVMKAAHGVSIVEIRRRDGQWRPQKGSRYNRRITADTPMLLCGPAAGDPLLRTTADPTGTHVHGTLNNCSGGMTPWGTLLTCEENFDQYFSHASDLAAQASGNADLAKAVSFQQRLPLPGGASERAWEVIDERFDLSKHPHEAFRFGWVVEIDPYDPQSTPKKRTALGRFKHEAATAVIAIDGQAVVYSGDDSRFEYVYKFVSARRWHPHARHANLDLLDEGTLYAAQFKADGTGQWLPLIWSAMPNDPANPLNPANGFNSQAEVLIDARRAGDLVGATPMDRPEDLETDPVTGKVYLVMTNNSQRSGGSRTADGRMVDADADGANPRQPNHNGHIIELTEAGGDAAATRFGWEIFMLCGNPKDAAGKLLTSLDGTPLADQDTYFAGYAEADAISPIATPDNITFDRAGNLWIATDGQPESIAINDGIFAVPTQGPQRGQVRQFLSGPKGCEICGPLFTPDNETLFVNIQHPGEGGSLTQPVSDWPDRAGKPPRPSVVAVRKVGAGSKLIGSGAMESVSWLDRWKDH